MNSLAEDVHNKRKNEEFEQNFRSYRIGKTAYSYSFEDLVTHVEFTNVHPFDRGVYGALYHIQWDGDDAVGKHVLIGTPQTLIEEFALLKQFGDVGIGPKAFGELAYRLNPPSEQAVSSTNPQGVTAEGFFAMERFQMNGFQYLTAVLSSTQLSVSDKAERQLDLATRIFTLNHKLLVRQSFVCADAKLENTLLNHDSNFKITKLVLADFGGEFCKNLGLSFDTIPYFEGKGRLFTLRLLMVSIAASTWHNTNHKVRLYLTEIGQLYTSLQAPALQVYLKNMCGSHQVFRAPMHYVCLAMLRRALDPRDDCVQLLLRFLELYLTPPQPPQLRRPGSLHRRIKFGD
tara:strand:+ start:21093 stop:22127 length:1035 start_codon:yes stop_codon:yes gene_type:complete